MKYFIYCRKSTDEDNRQVQSIESQLDEAKAFATKENLEVIRIFTESKTAKAPGREIFNEMLLLLEKGVADGIIAWHPDRLARNSIDGGKIIYLMDTGIIKDLKFPTYWIDNTPQGKFALSLAFGQSKYYVDNLSQNVKRGLRTKLKKGEWPTKALPGYLNKDKKVIPNPETFELVKKLFYVYGEGNHTLDEMRDLSFKWGFTTPSGKKLAVSMVQSILTNPFYTGMMVYGGKRYEGNHTQMINIGKFLQVQKVLKNRGKQAFAKREAPAYRGIMTCGECGGSITSEVQKGHIYYRCTKKKGVCNQKYTREEELDKQISKVLKNISIDKEARDLILTGIKQISTVEFDTHFKSLKFWQSEYNKIEERRRRVVDIYTDGLLPKDEYEVKQGQLMIERKNAKENLEACEKAGDRWLEQHEHMVIVATMAQDVFVKGDLKDKREIVKSIGSNFILRDQKLDFTWIEPFNYMVKKKTSTDWLPDLDSNQD